VELIFTNDIFMKLEGGSLNPKSTFGELMEKAALNTVIGMGTVFAVLILISLIIACFGFIPKIQDAFAKKEAPETPSAPVSAPVVAAQSEEDDTELVAVIAAAIAAYEGSTNTDGFVVRSIRRR
jgi:sodium pump decarboxylase gamma subunit